MGLNPTTLVQWNHANTRPLLGVNEPKYLLFCWSLHFPGWLTNWPKPSKTLIWSVINDAAVDCSNQKFSDNNKVTILKMVKCLMEILLYKH